MAALVFGAGLWLRYAGAFPFPVSLFVLATMGTALSSLPLVTGWASAWGGRHFAGLLVALYSVLVTAIVTTSGGPRSLFTFLYVLAVMEGCFLLSRVGGLGVGGVSSLLYVGLVVGRTILPL